MSDIALSRVSLVRANQRRLGRSLPLAMADAGAPPFSRPFDRVVLDLPCTGTGTLRRHPEIKWRISESEIGRLSRQALRLLEGSAPVVAPGGRLIAITCSLEREENEDVMARFLATHSDFSLLPLEGMLETTVASGVTGPGAWQVLTGGDHDGFTVNVLAKAPV
jgi:16S rRNA (cytosine967-C5)-methyltransferase